MSDDIAPLRPLEEFEEASIYDDAPLPKSRRAFLIQPARSRRRHRKDKTSRASRSRWNSSVLHPSLKRPFRASDGTSPTLFRRRTSRSFLAMARQERAFLP